MSAGAEIPVKKPGDSKKKNGKDNFEGDRFGGPTGYCIRTGVPIPFDIDRPLSNVGYKSWNKIGDIFCPEKFCHFSGEYSKGKNCYDRPVLKKNWDRAQDVHFL